MRERDKRRADVKGEPLKGVGGNGRMVARPDIQKFRDPENRGDEMYEVGKDREKRGDDRGKPEEKEKAGEERQQSKIEGR